MKGRVITGLRLRLRLRVGIRIGLKTHPYIIANQYKYAEIRYAMLYFELIYIDYKSF
jgi:hypothetical protein